MAIENSQTLEIKRYSSNQTEYHPKKPKQIFSDQRFQIINIPIEDISKIPEKERALIQLISGIDGIKQIFLFKDSLTINSLPNASWSNIDKGICSVLKKQLNIETILIEEKFPSYN